jgi:hypothetical protein
MCLSCEPAHYLKPDLTCSPCPTEQSIREARLHAIGPFLAMLLALFAVVTLLMWLLEIATSKSRRAAWIPAMYQSGIFCLGFGLSLQFMAASASSMPPGLPSSIAYVFTLTSFFNLDPSYVGYEGCGVGYPFTTSTTIMTLVLSLLILQGVLEVLKKRQRRNEAGIENVVSNASLVLGARVTHATHGHGVVVSTDETPDQASRDSLLPTFTVNGWSLIAFGLNGGLLWLRSGEPAREHPLRKRRSSLLRAALGE